MIQVKTFKNKIEIYTATFETLDLANAWIEEGKQTDLFGTPEESEIVIKDITAEIEQEKTNAECLKYLQETDYYIVRFMETGKEVPQEVLDKRAEARLKIVK
jgi:hypothetical protein